MHNYKPWQDEESLRWDRWWYRLRSHQDTDIRRRSWRTLAQTRRHAPAVMDSRAAAGRHCPPTTSSTLAPTDTELSHSRRPAPACQITASTINKNPNRKPPIPLLLTVRPIIYIVKPVNSENHKKKIVTVIMEMYN